MNLRPVAASLLAAAILAPAVCGAQFPNRPVRVVVPFGAGGVTDSVARITANEVARALGQAVVVENKPGAEGAIAANTVKNSPPDGYTLFFATSSSLSTPLISKAAGFDPVADFAPISTVGRFTYGLFVHVDVPAKSIKELVAYARANPGKINYGTVNSLEQLASAQFLKATGTDMTRIPYKTTPVIDLVAGRIQVYFGPVGQAIAHVKEGRARMLAVFAPERSPLAPDVPTMAEAGVPGLTVNSYQMFLAPAKTPPEVVDRLSREINAALRKPEIRADLEKISLVVEGMTPPQLARTIEEANRTWVQFFRDAGIERQ